MAKAKAGTPKVNKSAAIREFLLQNPKAKQKEVVEALAANGTKITPALVYMIMGKQKSKAKKAKRTIKIEKSRELGINDPVEVIQQVIELGNRIGGMKQLRAYPNNPELLKAIMASAKCSRAI